MLNSVPDFKETTIMKEASLVDRALGLLQYLARNPGEHGVRSLSVALDLSPSTIHRLLESLMRYNYVRQNPFTQKYSVGVQAVQLGISALGSFDVTAVAPPLLRSLVAETGESAFLAVLDDGEVVYLFKEEGSRAIRTTARLGSRRPAHCTALGKAFLATMPPAEARALLEQKGMAARTPNTITDMGTMWQELAEIRLRSYAMDREEVELGLVCFAAPVRDYSGQTVAAISVAGPVERMLPNEAYYGQRISATAREIALSLGYVPRTVVEPVIPSLESVAPSSLPG
jgi:IclR family transcriptional regulator, KDG regulon repressor